MNPEANKLRMQTQLDKFGCLPSVGQMQTLPAFDPLTLAQALEAALYEAGEVGHTKITIHLDLRDAYALAQSLRK